MNAPLRLGVIGLGARWRQYYRPALQALQDRFTVSALHDQVQHLATQEARRLGCAASPGPTQLLESDGVEAVLLPDPQWYGLWPVEVACRAGKPVLLATLPILSEPRADAVAAAVRQAGSTVLVENGPRLAPAAARLGQLLDERLGPARHVLCRWQGPPRSAAFPPEDPAVTVAGPDGLGILTWAASLLGGEPEAVLAWGDAGAGPGGVVLRFPEGRVLEIHGLGDAQVRPELSAQVVAAQGSATVRFPRSLAWSDADGSHRHRVGHPRPSAQETLLRFHTAVCGGTAGDDELAPACQARAWLQRAAQSQREGCWIPFDATVPAQGAVPAPAGS